jgi:hypothetical protein
MSRIREGRPGWPPHARARTQHARQAKFFDRKYSRSSPSLGLLGATIVVAL